MDDAHDREVARQAGIPVEAVTLLLDNGWVFDTTKGKPYTWVSPSAAMAK